jgi:hypothetical protein
MPVKEKDDDIIVRIPRKLYSKELQNMLNLIEHKKVVSKSKATEKEIQKILVDLKKERGKKTKLFLKERGIILG